MKLRFSSTLAVLLTFALIAPPVFLLVPQHVKAQYTVTEIGPNLLTNIKTTVESTISAIRNTITSVASVTSAAANVAMQINDYVLQPLAFVISGNLVKAITSSVIAFVIGKANSTGLPQFITDLQASMQTVGDSQALAFFTQWGMNSKSPFASSIASSLRASYLRNTSVAGFWAANMDTLSRSSKDANRFLAGDWSQGGARAWFALTTQDQNNPYALYRRAQGQLGSLVSSAQTTRTIELNWGQGMMSWCGGDKSSSNVSLAKGVNPGDPCTNSDGTPGTIRTPGSVILASLNKALGADQDQVARLGNVGPEINGILRNIATVAQTVQFGSQLLGDTGGLFGVGQSSGASSMSRLSQYQNTQGNMGVTQSEVIENSATYLPSGADMGSRLTQYQSSWSTIRSSANTASTSVMALVNHCVSQAKAAQDIIKAQDDLYDDGETNPVVSIGTLTNFVTASNAQANAAREALTNEIMPVFSQAAAADAIIATAKAMVEKVNGEAETARSDPDTYSADVTALQTMAPTASDAGNAQQDAQTFGTATAIPFGSLTVSGSSIVDRMNLISQNAESLKSSCDLPYYGNRANPDNNE